MSIITVPEVGCWIHCCTWFKLSLLAQAPQLNVGTPKPWLWQNVGYIHVSNRSCWVEPFRHTLSLPPTVRHVSVTPAHSRLIDTHLLLSALPHWSGRRAQERITGHLLLMYCYTHFYPHSRRLHHSLYFSWTKIWHRWIARWSDGGESWFCTKRHLWSVNSSRC